MTSDPPDPRCAHRERRRPLHGVLMRGLVFLVAFVVTAAVAWFFAHHQSLWFDEVSHMRGLRLGPVEVARWLQGVNPNRFLVPADRNPPFSYWVGQAWMTLFGYSETALRCMGISLLLASVLVVTQTVCRVCGNFAGLLAGLLFGLSPNVLDGAIEIRSYSVWLFLASLAWSQLVQIAATPQRDTLRLLWLSLICLCSSYTHFFGVVEAASTMSLSAIILLIRDRQRWRWVAAAAIIYGVGILGLAPYVRWAITHVAGAEAELDPLTTGFKYGLGRMIYRLFGHPAAGVYEEIRLALMSGYGIALLFGLSSIVGLRQETNEQHREIGSLNIPHPSSLHKVAVVLAVAIALGLTCNIAGRLAVASFDPLRSRYSLWMLPGVVILSVVGLAIGWRQSGLPRRLAWVATVLLCIGGLGMLAVLVRNVDHFTHGPHRLLVAEIRKSDQRPMVVFEPSRIWGFGFVPLLDEFGEDLTQYRAVPSPPDHGAGKGSAVLEHLRGPRTWDPDGDDVPIGAHLFVIHLESYGQHELRAHIRGDGVGPPWPPGPVLQKALDSGAWRITSEVVFVSYTACHAVMLERIK